MQFISVYQLNYRTTVCLIFENTHTDRELNELRIKPI